MWRFVSSGGLAAVDQGQWPIVIVIGVCPGVCVIVGSVSS
eukprot:SAG31_NODE_20467_length_573_cov_1.364979_1_plen_39_part_01